MSKTINSLGKILTWVITILLILGLFGGIAYFAMQKSGMNFYVEYNGKKYLSGSDAQCLCIFPGQENKFSVKSLNGESVNYSVKILTNDKNNFDYYVDGKAYKWSGKDEKLNDYTDVFGLKKLSDGFSFKFDGVNSLNDIVSKKFPDKQIELPSGLDFSREFFIIEIKSDGGSLRFYFSVVFGAESIVLTPGHIIF